MEEIKQEIDATPEAQVHERPQNWEYDVAAECIRKAVSCLKQSGVHSANLKIRFEDWLEASCWINVSSSVDGK